MGKNTYAAVGNKEDISDLITNITPTDTPLLSAFGKGDKADATYHEWLEDKIAKPKANKQVEGVEYKTDDPEPRARLGNHTQIFMKGYGVTGTQEAVQKHGVKSEIGYQMVKAMKEIAGDIEFAILTQTADVAGSAIVPREFKGVPGWLTTNKLTAGAVRPFTEDLLNDALQKAWDQGGTPKKVYLSGKQKRKVSAWSGDGDKHLDQNSKKLVNSIAVYESDFGIVSFVPHRLMTDDVVFIIDHNFFKMSYLRNLKTMEKPKTHDKIEKIIIGELTLEARAEKASAIIEKLSA